MNIPTHPRYHRALMYAQRILDEQGITSFPVDMHKLITRNHWTLIPYSAFVEKYGIPLADVISELGPDGFCRGDEGHCEIAFNDTVHVKGRIRFTLAHEVGHIYLGHLSDFSTKMFFPSKSVQYTTLEKEADCFARNLLSPASLMMRLEIQDVSRVMKTFGLSAQAARVRLKALDLDMQVHAEGGS